MDVNEELGGGQGRCGRGSKNFLKFFWGVGPGDGGVGGQVGGSGWM